MTSQQPPEPQSLFETVLDALEFPVLVHDREQILFANGAACRGLLAGDSSMAGRPLSDIVHSDGIAAGSERRRLVFDQGHEFLDIPVKLRAMDGSIVYARVDARRIIWHDEPAIVLSGRFTPKP